MSYANHPYNWNSTVLEIQLILYIMLKVIILLKSSYILKI